MGTSIQNLPESADLREVHRSTDMRNAVIGCSAAMLFGLAVLLMSIFSVANPQSVYPAEEVLAKVAGPVSVRVEYYLPYPGILPDSSLYRLKALRDKVRLVLTFGQEAKAEKELLFADKRIGAAAALIEGGKVSLGVSTATKAEKYLESAVKRIIALQRGGHDVKSMLGILTKATAKHIEVLETMMERTGDEKGVLGKSWQVTKSLSQQVQQTLVEAK